MEARLAAPARLLLALAAVVICAAPVVAAGYQTTNFIVQAPTPHLAKEIGDSAEMWRTKLAIEWIGREMPPWSQQCRINARVAPRLGAGGATTFVFDRGEVFGWDMNIQGSRERVLDSVLPHEITHTVFACYFRKPLPRWADEGACTTVEHPSEIATQERLLIDFLRGGKGIAFSKMFAMKEYPADVLPLYAQGHSLTRFLLMKRGKAAFLDFLSDGMEDENWPRAVRQHYGHQSLHELQNDWLAWVKQGRPELDPDYPAIQVAANEPAVEAPAAAPSTLAASSAVLPVGHSEPKHESAYARAARDAAPLPSGTVQDASRGSVWRR